MLPHFWAKADAKVRTIRQPTKFFGKKVQEKSLKTDILDLNQPTKHLHHIIYMGRADAGGRERPSMQTAVRRSATGYGCEAITPNA